MKSTISPHVEFIFKTLYDELASIKQQQWKITHYTALVLAAAFALKTGVKDSTFLWWLWIYAVWVTAVFGSHLLWKLQKDMGRYRKRIDGLHDAYFDNKELIDIGLTQKELETLGKLTGEQQSWRNEEFVRVMMFILIFGALLISVAKPLPL